MRKKIIAGNWKMYKTIQEADQTITSLSDKINGTEINNAIYIAAPFPFLDRLIQKFGNNSIHYDQLKRIYILYSATFFLMFPP